MKFNFRKKSSSTQRCASIFGIICDSCMLSCQGKTLYEHTKVATLIKCLFWKKVMQVMKKVWKDVYEIFRYFRLKCKQNCFKS